MNSGDEEYDSERINHFINEYDRILEIARDEYEYDPPSKYNRDGYNTFQRMYEDKEHYILFLRDMSVPPTNNAAERSLRDVKSHMKISGQFESVEAADDHALIKTYIETCRRNNINEIIALQRLCDGKPYTVQEILSQASK